ncbi:MAG: DUF2304 domain-containing protein [Erysipelotrichaceae bacterium]|nr:DUF2304 domain-containing protein [Erysipelotrichaceae bacterium]
MLYTILLTVSIITLLYVLRSVIKNRLNIKYAMVWILWALGMILISIFPDIVIKLSGLLGIIVPSNTVFLIFIFLLYCLTFYVYLKLSRHNEDIINLNYELAALKKKVEELEKKQND